MKLFNSTLLLVVLCFTASFGTNVDVVAASVATNVKPSKDVKLIKRNGPHLFFKSPAPDCGPKYHCAFGDPDIRLDAPKDGTYCPCSNIDENGYGRDGCQYPTVSVVEAVCESGSQGTATIYFGETYSYYTTTGTIYLNWESGSAPGGDYTQSSAPGDDVSIKCHPF